jgi:predicted negative regulator of RcsB-dependent stress response
MAQRHASSRRRGGEHKNVEVDDLFIARLVELTSWAGANRQTLLVFGVVVAVIVAGILYYVNFNRTLEEQASIQIEQIEQTIAMGDPGAARAQLSQFLDRFGGTPSAPEARLALAHLHLRDGQIEQTIDVLEASEASLRHPLGLQMELLKGKAFEAAGRLEDAESAFLRVAGESELQFVRVDALAAAARVRAARGNPAGAAELYQRVVDDLPEGHPDRGFFQMRTAEARTAIRR